MGLYLRNLLAIECTLKFLLLGGHSLRCARASARWTDTLKHNEPRNPASRMSAVVRLQSGGWDRTRLLIRRLESADYLYLHRQCRGFWLRSDNKKMTVQLTVSNAFISNQAVENPRIIPHPWLFPPQPSSLI